MSDRLGNEPIEPEFHDLMNRVAQALDELFNDNDTGVKKVGFILMTFNFGDDGRCNYISNAQRADVIALLKEQLSYFEGMPEPQPTRNQ